MRRFWILLLCGLTALLATLVLADTTNRPHRELTRQEVFYWFQDDNGGCNGAVSGECLNTNSSSGTIQQNGCDNAGFNDVNAPEFWWPIPRYMRSGVITQMGAHLAQTTSTGWAAGDFVTLTVVRTTLGTDSVLSLAEFYMDDSLSGGDEICAGTDGQEGVDDDISTAANCDRRIAVPLDGTLALAVNYSNCVNVGDDGDMDIVVWVIVDY